MPITCYTTTGLSLYALFGDGSDTAVALTEGASLKAGLYTASDAAIAGAGLAAGEWPYRLLVGSAGAKSASDPQVGAGSLRWSGTAEVLPLDATETQAASAAAITAADLVTSLTAAIQDGLLNEADGKAVLAAIADKIAADWVAGDASPLAIVSAILASAPFKQMVRDAAKLAPSGGAAAAGSLDAQLAAIDLLADETKDSLGELRTDVGSAGAGLTAITGKLPASGVVPNTTQVATPTNVTNAQTAIIGHGDTAWAGGTVTLTEENIEDIADAVVAAGGGGAVTPTAERPANPARTRKVRQDYDDGLVFDTIIIDADDNDSAWWIDFTTELQQGLGIAATEGAVSVEFTPIGDTGGTLAAEVTRTGDRPSKGVLVEFDPSAAEAGPYAMRLTVVYEGQGSHVALGTVTVRGAG